MGALGKGKLMISASVEGRWHAYVALRAKANELTTSKMTALILRHWFATGAPAVFEGERGAAVLPWDAAIKWEALVEAPTLPDRAAMPRDNPAFSRAMARR